MILQELNKLYDRLKNDPEYTDDIPVSGYSKQKISFVIVLNPDGTLFDIRDERVKDGKKTLPKELLVPGGAHKTGKEPSPRLLWDNIAYCFGAGGKDLKYFKSAQELYKKLRDQIDSEEFKAVATFMENWDPQNIPERDLKKIAEYGKNFGVFQICGESHFVHDVEAVKKWWDENGEAGIDIAKKKKPIADQPEQSMCLVSGKITSPARLHEPKIKGVVGAQSSGALIVSFNKDAFESYGWEQGRNASVSKDAANHYCTALNALLNDSKHRFRLGDTTVVFWTGEKTETENNLLAFLFNSPAGTNDESNVNEDEEETDFAETNTPAKETPPAQDAATLQRVEDFLKNLREAKDPKTALEKSGIDDNPETPFFMLGLSPNASRISVRFWYAGTLGGFLERLKAHQLAMQIRPRSEKFGDPKFVSLWQILRQTARTTKDIPPLLSGALMRSVLEGLPYPLSALQLIVNRLRLKGDVNYIRASFIKAFLIRNKKQEITMSLDKNNKQPAYLLGRLFAVLEKAQKEAIPGINAGIREKFYASASATPRTVFPVLLRNYPNHLAKLEKNHEIFYDKLVQEIISGIEADSAFPSHLGLEEQGLFAIGYYHQTQDLFTPKNNASDAEEK